MTDKGNEVLSFKPVALPCSETARGKLHTTNLFKGACPHSCLYCYASGFKTYKDAEPMPVLIEAVRNIRKWPARLFLSSATDPFHPLVLGLAEELLHRALRAGTFVVISTKALATLGIVKLLSEYRGQVSYTVSLSSLDEERNCILEPKAASAMERLHGRREDGEITFCGIEQLAQKGIHITLKADTLFPRIDDAEESIMSLLEEAKRAGVEAVTFSYAFYRNKFKRKLASVPFLRDSLAAMSESQPIASGTGYSLPLMEKRTRLLAMARMAEAMGFDIISTCRCKNQIDGQIDGIPEDSALRLTCHFHDGWF